LTLGPTRPYGCWYNEDVMAKGKNVELDPEVLEQADRLARAENKTVDELANEAVKRYALDKLVRYGKSRAQALGYKPEDVGRLITESRQENRSR
jgi:predicted transcriptional regulator